MSNTAYKTVFGSLDRFDKGGVQIIGDDVKHYAFSNCFEIASSALFRRGVFSMPTTR